jgi:hypothetical protein
MSENLADNNIWPQAPSYLESQEIEHDPDFLEGFIQIDVPSGPRESVLEAGPPAVALAEIEESVQQQQEREETTSSTAKTPTPRFSPSNDERIYISETDISDQDVFSGREFRGSDHPGNVEYLRIIREHRPIYVNFGRRHSEKTSLRNTLVDHDIRGRFIKVDDVGRFYLMTQDEARAKVSQSLREQ